MSAERNRVTVDLDDDVATMLDRATRAPGGRRPWGLQSFKINEALRDFLTRSGYARKREQSVTPSGSKKFCQSK
jgi:hypothetical protein